MWWAGWHKKPISLELKKKLGRRGCGKRKEGRKGVKWVHSAKCVLFCKHFPSTHSIIAVFYYFCYFMPFYTIFLSWMISTYSIHTLYILLYTLCMIMQIAFYHCFSFVFAIYITDAFCKTHSINFFFYFAIYVTDAFCKTHPSIYLFFYFIFLFSNLCHRRVL